MANMRLKTVSKRSDHLVCALAYDGLCTFEFGIAVEIFALDRPELDIPWYRFQTVAIEPPPLRARGGVTINVDHGLDALEEADTIVMSGWRSPAEPVPEPALDAIRRAHARGCRLVSICSGVFMLAATGLLNGRRATTHWYHTDRLREAYPAVNVEPGVLYIDGGDNIFTSAGSAAGLDLGLQIVRMDHGSAVANNVARRLVLPAHREGGQAQFIDGPVVRESGNLSPMMEAVRTRLAEAISVKQMADLAGMSERTLIRRFQETVGMAPLAWLTAERVRHAADLLETTRASVEEVAAACGFGSPEVLRHHFKRRYGATPSAFRRSFADPLAAE